MTDPPRRRTIDSNIMPMDGLDFRNADVKNNTFTFSGGNVPLFGDTEFSKNTIRLIGAAENTIEFLNILLRLSPTSDRTLFLRAWGFIDQDEEVRKVTSADVSEDA